MEKNIFSCNNNQLFLNDKLLLETLAEINECVVLSNSIILLLKGADIDDDRNIFCFEFNGHLNWQIAAPNKIHYRNYYTSIYLSDSGELQAFNKNGFEITIDIKDGKILKKELIK